MGPLAVDQLLLEVPQLQAGLDRLVVGGDGALPGGRGGVEDVAVHREHLQGAEEALDAVAGLLREAVQAGLLDPGAEVGDGRVGGRAVLPQFRGEGAAAGRGPRVGEVLHRGLAFRLQCGDDLQGGDARLLDERGAPVQGEQAAHRRDEGADPEDQQGTARDEGQREETRTDGAALFCGQEAQPAEGTALLFGHGLALSADGGDGCAEDRRDAARVPETEGPSESSELTVIGGIKQAHFETQGTTLGDLCH